MVSRKSAALKQTSPEKTGAPAILSAQDRYVLVDSFFMTTRHGLSLANTKENHKVYATTVTSAIPLDPQGVDQIDHRAEFIRHFIKMYGINGNLQNPVKAYSRDYRRSEQSCIITIDDLPEINWLKSNQVEHPHVEANELIGEQRFGKFAGLTKEEAYELYPEDARFYDLNKDDEATGGLYARAPSGEDAAGVLERWRLFKLTKLDVQMAKGHKSFLLDTHGVCMRTAPIALMDLHPHNFAKEHVPGNAAIRLISYDEKADTHKDWGYIWDEENGSDVTQSAQQIHGLVLAA